MKIYKLNTNKWFIERTIFALAGIFILIGLTLSLTVSPYFLIFIGFVGVMQLIFAITGYCPLAIILKNLGVSEL